MSEKTDAIVIRHVDFSETSKIVAFFTRDFGKVAALAKGAKRLRGPFEAALDLLSVCRIVFLRKSASSLNLLTEAQLVARFRPNGQSRANLLSLYAGYYVAELLDSLTEDFDPHPILFAEAVAALERFSAEDDHQRAILRFELAVLREIGQLPAFDACVACGTPVESGLPFSFWVAQSALICRNCRHDEYQHLRLEPGTIAALNKLADESDAGIDRLTLSPHQIQELRAVLTAAISHVLGRRPKMLRYLQSGQS
jgi:DNA repair protein RecO (recombination protein O)